MGKRIGVLLVIFLSVAFYSLQAAGSRVGCLEQCNRQYHATLRYCTNTLTSSPGKGAWYADCVKNAKKFRVQCQNHCQ